MKKTEIRNLVRLMLTPALMVLLGILLIVRPDSASAVVGKILGWGMILLGAGTLIESLAVRDIAASRVLFVAVTLALGSWLLRNPLRLAAALGRVAGLLILLPMTTSRAVWVILGILVILVAVLMAIDRLKPGKLLGDGGNVIDAQ